MRPKRTETSISRALILPEGLNDQLVYLKEKVEADSDSGVISRALVHYENLLIDMNERGMEPLFQNSEGEEVTPIPNLASYEEGRPIKRNFSFYKRTIDRMAFLRGYTNAESDAEVIREALRVYYGLVRNASEGNQLILRNPNTGWEKVYLVPGVRNERRTLHPHAQFVPTL